MQAQIATFGAVLPELSCRKMPRPVSRESFLRMADAGPQG